MRSPYVFYVHVLKFQLLNQLTLFEATCCESYTIRDNNLNAVNFESSTIGNKNMAEK
jgi:hypothetical protein